MNAGDAVLVWSGAMPVGGRVIGLAEHRAGADVVLWIDVCVMGNHLPQMYRGGEVRPVDADTADRFGLCRDCLGYGAASPQQLVAGIDEVVDSCGSCRGVGRPSMDVIVLREPNVTEGMLTWTAHEPLPYRTVVDETPAAAVELWAIFGVDLDSCLRCGRPTAAECHR